MAQSDSEVECERVLPVSSGSHPHPNISTTKSSSDQTFTNADATRIVFLCNINYAGIIWRSILNKAVDASEARIKKLAKVTKEFSSLVHRDDVTASVHFEMTLLCAKSSSFLHLCMDLNVAALQGLIHDGYLSQALQILQLFQMSWILSGSPMRKYFLHNWSISFFLESLQSLNSISITQPTEVEGKAQTIFLSLFWYYIYSTDIFELPNVDNLVSLLDNLSSSPIQLVSILSLASKAFISRTILCKDDVDVPINDNVFEVLSEYILETAGSSRQHYNGMNTSDILHIFQELVFNVIKNREIYEQLSIVTEEELVDFIHEYNLPSSSPTETTLDHIHKHVLPTFVSPLPDDLDGTFFVVSDLLTTIDNIFHSYNKKFASLSVNDVNVIKTIINVLMSTIQVCEDREINDIANFIANQDILLEALLLTLQAKGKLPVPPYDILISLSLEIILVLLAGKSAQFCKEFSNMGGLLHLLIQINKLNDTEFNKVTEHLISGHLALLFKSIVPTPYSTIPKIGYKGPIKFLQPLINLPDLAHRVCLKTVLSQLPAVIDNDESPYLQLKDDESDSLLSLLANASEKGVSEIGFLTYSSNELLSCIINFAKLPVNLQTFYNGGIIDALKALMCSDDYNIQRMSLELCISFLSNTTIREKIFCYERDIILVLKCLQQSPCTTTYILAQHALQQYQWQHFEDDVSLYLYCYACLLLGHYNKCILILEQCDPNDMNNKLLLGKALVQQYRREQRILDSELDYFTMSDLKRDGMVKKCYQKAKKAINYLGLCLDRNCIDHQGSEMLKVALMDCVRETSGLSECNRCYLCLKWRELRKSHICPESVLKEIAKVNFSPEETQVVTTFTGRHTVRTPGTEVKWLLCGVCEQKLSNNGEQQFIKDFFRLVYPCIRSSCITYDKMLYRFCIGLAFRVLSLTDISKLSNTDELYQFNEACRDYLNNMDQTQNDCNINNPVMCISKWNFYLYMNPSNFYSTQMTREEILNDLLTCDFIVQVSKYRLGDGEMGYSISGYFLVMIIGTVTILVKFKAEKLEDLPPSYIQILPEGGVFNIPDELQRWQDILPGMSKVLEDCVLTVQSRLSEVFWGKVSVAGKHKGSQLPPSYNMEIEEKSSKALSPTLVSVQKALFTKLIDESINVINLLPRQFKISKTLGSENIVIPSRHVILNHEIREDNAMFLVSGLKHDGYDIYGLVCQRRKQTSDLIYGFHLEINCDTNVYTVSRFFMPFPVKDSKSAFVQGVVKEIEPLIESCLKRFYNLATMNHFVKLNRECYDKKWLAFDRKCSTNDCWYCKDSCHNCMKPASLGLTKRVDDVLYKHCCNCCLELHFNNVDKTPVQVEAFCKQLRIQSEKMLLMVTRVLSTKMSSNTVLCLQLCVSQNDSKLIDMKPYAVLQIRTLKANAILSFYVNLDLSIGDPLWYCTHADTIASIDNVRGSDIVQQLLLLGLEKSGHSNLQTLLATVEF